MNFKKYTASVFVFIGLLSLILVGCGDTKQTTQNTTEKDKGKLMEQIKKRGKVIVGTEAAFAPFEFVENGKIVGYGSDILQEIIKNMDVELEQFDVPFSGILPGLEEKKFDFIATVLTVSSERKEKYGMTIPIGDGSLAILKRQDDASINTIDDLNGKIIGGGTNSVGSKTMIKYNEKSKSEGKEGLKEVKQYPSMIEAHLDLQNGNIDVVIENLPAVNELIKKQPDTFKIVGIFGEKRYISWATRKEDTDLLNFLNTEILKLKKSGKLAELQQKWFGTTWDLPDQLPN